MFFKVNTSVFAEVGSIGFLQSREVAMLGKLFGVLVLALIGGGASAQGAPVKCISPSGAVSYVQGACPDGAKYQAVPGVVAAGGPEGAWSYEKGRDSMTGEVACVAWSPELDVPTKRAWHRVQLGVQVLPVGEQVVLVSRKPDVIFHHVYSGTGLQVDAAPMTAFAARSTQQRLVMSLDQSASLVTAMLAGSTARARVRFWPWDETADSRPVTLTGFKQALALARVCRGR